MRTVVLSTFIFVLVLIYCSSSNGVIMSEATKRKHVVDELLHNDFVEISREDNIVRITDSRGNNLHEVENFEGKRFLVSMPTKFRRKIWVKRGDFVIIDPIEEGDKVKGEIVKILTKENVKELSKESRWPFKTEVELSGEELLENPNRRPQYDTSSDESSSDEGS